MHVPPLFRDLADFLYPARCAACDDTCQPGDWLCLRCLTGMENLTAHAACARCALPIVSNGAPCPWCRGRGVYPFTNIARLGKFEGPLRDMVHHLKYHRRWTVAERLATQLIKHNSTRRILDAADVLVPIPLHWQRQISRGYNQADVIATALAKQTNLKVTPALRRLRSTQSQTDFHSRTEREANVHKAFALTDTSLLTDQRVIVVDDVMTTAATLQAAARAILPAKPRSLSALVLAVADPRNQDFEFN